MRRLLTDLSKMALAFGAWWIFAQWAETWDRWVFAYVGVYAVLALGWLGVSALTRQLDAIERKVDELAHSLRESEDAGHERIRSLTSEVRTLAQRLGEMTPDSED